MSDQKVVTRFAPSPTGFMHVGGIRTALYAYAYAKRHGGTFILRIEDTDKEREVAGAKEHIMEALRWLGIQWDFGPDTPSEEFGSCIQSERLHIYTFFARRLLATGHAYVDPYSESQIKHMREQAEAKKELFLYRNHRPEHLNIEWKEGQTLRFKVGNIKRYKWHDAVRGDLEAGEEALDDFVLIKSDGYPTYNFCHVVDDIVMGVTHVMRGEEFIASCPKFLSLYEALGETPPVYVTLPPILGDEGTKKLSKRDGAKDVLEYRTEGYLPQAIFNFLAFLGWNPGDDREILTPEEIIQLFDVTRVQRSGAKFNTDKLDWTNKEHIKKLGTDEAVRRMLSYFPEDIRSDVRNRIEHLAPTALERVHILSDYYRDFKNGEYSYLEHDPEYREIQVTWKEEGTEAAMKHLAECRTFVENVFLWTPEGIKDAIFPYADANGRGSVLWPLRVTLSGKEKSPDPFTLIYVLGRDETVSRINRAIRYLSGN